MLYGIVVAGFGLFLVLLAGFFSSEDMFLTARQMKAGCVFKGLPFIWHGAMWGGFFIICPLLGIIIAKCAMKQTGEEYAIAIGVGLLISLIMHHTYMASDEISALIQNHELTSAGRVHVLFMWMAISILALFYFWTKHQSPELVWGTTGLFIIHLVLATHIPLKMWSPEWYPKEPVLDLPTVCTVVTCSSVLVWRSILMTR